MASARCHLLLISVPVTLPVSFHCKPCARWLFAANHSADESEMSISPSTVGQIMGEA